MEELICLKNVVTLSLDSDRCVGCGMCLIVCPHAVFTMKKGPSFSGSGCCQIHSPFLSPTHLGLNQIFCFPDRKTAIIPVATAASPAPVIKAIRGPSSAQNTPNKKLAGSAASPTAP